MQTAVRRPPRVPALHRTQSRVTATEVPISDVPTSSVPAPTVINAMGGAP